LSITSWYVRLSSAYESFGPTSLPMSRDDTFLNHIRFAFFLGFVPARIVGAALASLFAASAFSSTRSRSLCSKRMWEGSFGVNQIPGCWSSEYAGKWKTSFVHWFCEVPHGAQSSGNLAALAAQSDSQCDLHNRPASAAAPQAMHGKSRQGKARQDRAGQGTARQDKAGHGKARQGEARQGKARPSNARQGKARQGKARQGKARQGKARHGKAGSSVRARERS
jgi:hypothetical protein